MHPMPVLNGWPIVAWLGGSVVVMVALLAWSHGLELEGLRAILRATARTSLALFLAAFLASSLRRLWPTPATAWMLRNRRQLGVSFAVSHFVHGWAILELVRAGFETDVVTLVAGGLGYVLIAVLAATSFDGAVRSLGPRAWRGLHASGVWYLWALFAVTYIGQVAKDPLAATSFALLLVALGIRLAARRSAAA